MRKDITTSSEKVFRCPKSVQKSIPIEEIYEDGIFKHKKEYSACFEIPDIDYTATSEENQAGIILQYEEMIKAIAADVNMKVVLMNRKINEKQLKKNICLQMKNEESDRLRNELNEINENRALAGDNQIVRERYIVLSGEHQSKEAARLWFKQVQESLMEQITNLDTTCHQLDAEDRLRVLHHFFRPDAGDRFRFDFKEMRRSGAAVQDYIAPDGMVFPFEGSYFKIDDRYGRALMVRDFPALMDDTLLSGIMNLQKEMVVAADFVAMPKEVALRTINTHQDNIEDDINRRTQNAGRDGNWNARVPRHLQEERDTCEYLFDCLNDEDQRLILAQVVIVHMADSKEQLDLDTAAIQTIAQGKSCEIGILRHRQERGLNTALPYGLEYVSQRRIISSENAAFLEPFRTKEIFEPGGIVYGTNEISKNLILLNRMAYKNGNAFIVGDSGGGKGVLAKSEIEAVHLGTNDDMIVLDPDGEYRKVVEWLGGQTIRISSTSKDHINVMDLSRDFEQKDDPVTLKCLFISGMIDLMMRGIMTGPQRSITDRCVRNVLNRHTKRPATLETLYEELKKQKEDAAHDVALAMEIYATGSLNTFAQPTNVDISNRFICFDIKDLSPVMRDMGMMVVLDEIDRRVARNRKLGKHTWVWCDEIWTLLDFPQTEEYLWGFWKRCRKYGGLPTGITQGLSAINDSVRGHEMISNSEFVFMMGMSKEDREVATELFHLSDSQQQYLTNAMPGHGLLRAAKTVIPLDATISDATELYRVATTEISEVKEFEEAAGA